MNNTQVKKAYKGLPMEGLIASWYAKTTLKDLKRHKLMAKQLAEKIPANGKVLEIAPGPGYFCIELAKLGNYQITGLDISKSFVEIARKNAAEAGLKIDFRKGMRLPCHSKIIRLTSLSARRPSRISASLSKRLLRCIVCFVLVASASSRICAGMLHQKRLTAKSRAWDSVASTNSWSDGHLIKCC